LHFARSIKLLIVYLVYNHRGIFTLLICALHKCLSLTHASLFHSNTAPSLARIFNNLNAIFKTKSFISFAHLRGSKQSLLNIPSWSFDLEIDLLESWSYLGRSMYRLPSLCWNLYIRMKINSNKWLMPLFSHFNMGKSSYMYT
jgi:hypothetical protein